jgi:hypothetical protein
MFSRTPITGASSINIGHEPPKCFAPPNQQGRSLALSGMN